MIGSITVVPDSDFDELKRVVDDAFRVLNAGISGGDHDETVSAADEIRMSVDYVKKLIVIAAKADEHIAALATVRAVA